MLCQKFYMKTLGKKAFGEHLHLLNTIINVDWIIRSIYAKAKLGLGTTLLFSFFTDYIRFFIGGLEGNYYGIGWRL